jgi:HAD superfamily hydrolase (TIGR01509 family)
VSVALAAVVFDFDGVIADSEPLHLRTYQEVLGEFDLTLDPRDYYERYLGFDDAGVFRALAEDRGLRFTAQTLDALIARKAERLQALLGGAEALFPGAADCVRRCATAVPLAIASGALRPEIEHVLGAAGLRACFRAIVASGDTAKSKPAPDPYLRAVALLEADRSIRPAVNGAGSVAIEDSRWGIESAHAAGLRCIAVTHTYPPEGLRQADLIVRSLGEVTVEGLRRLVG